MILAGGTGGHVYPALAVARCLANMQIPVVWMGTRQGLEARVVPQAGIPIDWLSVSGLRGKGVFAWLLAPLRLNLAFFQALIILIKQKPRTVLGMGGFVSGPAGLVAFMLAKPLVIHEQNAILGLTNRLLAPLSKCLLEGFPGVFKAAKARYVGNPVRREITDLPPPSVRFARRTGRLRLLVLGGSLGAKVLNDIVPETISRFAETLRPQVWHQTGHLHINEATHYYRQLNLEVRLEAFIEDMARAYAWADLVLCRAGALTIAELCAAGIGAILVPYPFAVDDHQSANAHYMSDNGAGVLVPQNDLTPQRLFALLERFSLDRKSLLSMANKARSLSKVDADETVARICLEVARQNSLARTDRRRT